MQYLILKLITDYCTNDFTLYMNLIEFSDIN